MTPSDTPLVDAYKAKIPSGIDNLNVAVHIANKHLVLARDLERVARQMDEALADATYKLYGHGPAAPKEQNALDAWRAFEEKYK